jgi:alkanesulfonate monooxygenase SsuD/methylene tetrahydromethanopterin reductase-like flavin-dependent oxidoreductase (luciferase family)
MAAWAEGRGVVLAVLSEHHGTADRHLPSPMVLASALAARTQNLPIMLAALVLPFYETVRLAEDIAVLDIISRGRVSYVIGVGHRADEFEHFSVTAEGRGARADEQLAMLLRLLHGGGTARDSSITPRPTSGGPTFFVGGGSLAAARRAGRLGLGMLAQSANPGLVEAYEAACRAAGNEPGFVQIPQPNQLTVLFVADDVDRAWEEVGPHLLHDAETAASYRHGQTSVASISAATTVDELRADDAYRIVTLDEAVELVRAGTILPLHPLCGGLAPAVAWPYLQRAVDAVALGQARTTGGCEAV